MGIEVNFQSQISYHYYLYVILLYLYGVYYFNYYLRMYLDCGYLRIIEFIINNTKVIIITFVHSYFITMDSYFITKIGTFVHFITIVWTPSKVPSKVPSYLRNK